MVLVFLAGAHVGYFMGSSTYLLMQGKMISAQNEKTG